MCLNQDARSSEAGQFKCLSLIPSIYTVNAVTSVSTWNTCGIMMLGHRGNVPVQLEKPCGSKDKREWTEQVEKRRDDYIGRGGRARWKSSAAVEEKMLWQGTRSTWSGEQRNIEAIRCKERRLWIGWYCNRSITVVWGDVYRGNLWSCPIVQN